MNYYQVMEEIERNDIKIYQFPVEEFDDEEEVQDLQVTTTPARPHATLKRIGSSITSR